MYLQRRFVDRRPVAGRRRATALRGRRGSEILELVIVLPVLILIGLGIVSFGIFYTNRQQLALASRVGAEEASQTTGLETATEVPEDIRDAIIKQLQSSCIQVYKIRLEHNVDGTQQVLEWSATGTGTCPCGPAEPLDLTSTDCAALLGTYVRVTVCVEMKELMPNFLAAFGSGAGICGRVAQATTIFHYELD